MSNKCCCFYWLKGIFRHKKNENKVADFEAGDDTGFLKYRVPTEMTTVDNQINCITAENKQTTSQQQQTTTAKAHPEIEI